MVVIEESDEINQFYCSKHDETTFSRIRIIVSKDKIYKKMIQNLCPTPKKELFK